MRRRGTSTSTGPARFLIITVGRTGSSWLMEMLNSHAAIGGYGELLTAAPATRYPQTRAALYSDPGGIPFFAAYIAEQSKAVRLAAMPYLGFKYLSQVYEPRGGLEAIGFRLIYGHLRQGWGTPVPAGAWLLPYVAAKKVRVVHLVRRNKLDLLVSGEVAAARQLLHARPDDEIPPARISVGIADLPSKLDHALRKERVVRRTISSLRVPALEVAYEDLLSDTATEYRRVLELLGVRQLDHEPQWRMRKVVDTSLEETIENYDDVERALRNTRHAVFL